MQYLTIAAALLSSAVFSSAAPTQSAPLERRACSTAYPQAIGFPINYDIHKDAGNTNVRDDFISFTNIPAGSYGCQLEANFPAGYPIQSSGNALVNIYHASGPNDGQLFGSVTFASSPVAPTKFVINSETCSDLLSYRMSIASDTDAGDVAFADTQDAGLTITYNC